MPRPATRVHNPDYPPSRTMPALMTRLMTEDWHEMTRAASNSPGHPANLERWRAKAREANPHLDDDQIERLAVMLKKAHYVRMGKLSAEARRLAREAQAELDGDGDAPAA